MSRTKRCEVCGQKKLKVICVDCVERDMKNWENRMIEKGRQQAIKEELDFLKRLPKSWLEYSFMKERIKQLKKEEKQDEN